jgi:hypothetical protein
VKILGGFRKTANGPAAKLQIHDAKALARPELQPADESAYRPAPMETAGFEWLSLRTNQSPDFIISLKAPNKAGAFRPLFRRSGAFEA